MGYQYGNCGPICETETETVEVRWRKKMSKFTYRDRVFVKGSLPAFVSKEIIGCKGEIVGVYENKYSGSLYEVKIDKCLHVEGNLGIALLYEVNLEKIDHKVQLLKKP